MFERKYVVNIFTQKLKQVKCYELWRIFPGKCSYFHEKHCDLPKRCHGHREILLPGKKLLRIFCVEVHEGASVCENWDVGQSLGQSDDCQKCLRKKNSSKMDKKRVKAKRRKDVSKYNGVYLSWAPGDVQEAPSGKILQRDTLFFPL